MKKNYLIKMMSVLMLALFATSVKADVNSMVDLYGKYRFTATLELLDESFADKVSADCDVTIGKSAIYDAVVTGIGGATNDVHNVASIDTKAHTFTVNNPNGGAGLFKGAYFSNAEGKNPYGTIQRDFKVVYTYDPETKDITMDDFTVVTVSDMSSDDATIVAKFSNVKLTLVEAEVVEVADVSGEWIFSSTYSDEKSTFPTEFGVTLSKTSDDNKNYNVAIAIEGYDAVSTTATFDGAKLLVAYDSLCISAKDSLFFADYAGYKVKGSYEFSYISETNMSLTSGMSFVKRTVVKDAEGNDKINHEQIQWYGAGSLKLPTEAPAFDWTGTYKVTGELMAMPGFEAQYSKDFTFVVSYHEQWDMYLVTEFMGYDVFDVNNGGIDFTIAEDGMSATIKTGKYLDFNYDTMMARSIYDMNASTSSPLTLKLNEDGTLSLSAFCIQSTNYNDNSTALEAYYEKLVVTKENNAFVWNKGFTVTAEPTSVDGGNYPTEFAMEVEFVETTEEYYVINFMGYDITAMTYGGLKLTIAEDGKSATMPLEGNFGVVCMAGTYPNYVQLCDANGGTESLTLTVNADGTMSVSDFTLYEYNYDEVTWVGATGAKLASYTNVKATTVDAATNNWAGKYVFTYTDASWNTIECSLCLEAGLEEGQYYVTEFMNEELGSLNYGGLLFTVSKEAPTKATVKLNGAYGVALVAMLDNGNYLQLRDIFGGGEALGVTLNDNGSMTLDSCQLVEFSFDSFGPVGEPVNYPEFTAYKGGLTKGNAANIEVIEGEAEAIIDLNSNQPVVVYDMVGRKVFVGEANKVATLTKGIYVVKSANAAMKLNLR